jgi:hypothetical protein
MKVKEKKGWRVVKSKELEKIDSWEETKEELRNIGLVDGEDCKDWSHM